MKCYSKYCHIADTTGGMDCKNSSCCPYFDGINPEEQKSATDHPAHYQGRYECIDLMREIFGDEAVRNFCICNIYKYRFRAGKKCGEAAETDEAKAQWYENYMMRYLPMNQMLQSQKYIDVIRSVNIGHKPEETE